MKTALIAVGMDLVDGLSKEAKERIDKISWSINVLQAFGCRKHDYFRPCDHTFFVAREKFSRARVAGCLRLDKIRFDYFVKDPRSQDIFLAKLPNFDPSRHRPGIGMLESYLRKFDFERVALCGLTNIDELKASVASTIYLPIFIVQDAIEIDGFAMEAALKKFTPKELQLVTSQEMLESWCHDYID